MRLQTGCLGYSILNFNVFVNAETKQMLSLYEIYIKQTQNIIHLDSHWIC